LSVKNWVYGGKVPTPQEAVDEAIFTAHKYRNKLCELELEKRKRHYDLLRRLAPEFVAAEETVATLEAALGACREKIQAERVKQRTKTPTGCKTWIAESADIKSRLKDARAVLKAAKHAAYDDPAVKAAMDANSEQHKSECAQAKQESGLYWGTEAVIRDSCRSFASGAPPKFARYEGRGQLAVQVQGGMDCSKAIDENTLVYIVGEGRKRTAKVRIASDGGRPVFADLPIVFHRDLPDGAIKWAFLQKRMRANKPKYSLRLAIDVADPVDVQVPPGEVAIHVGWRKHGDGLKVVTWLGSDGEKGSLVLPASHCEDYLKLDKIKSERDIEFGKAIDHLRGWLECRGDVPEFLEEVRSHLHAWKSQKRLAALVVAWRDARFDPWDIDIFEYLEAWRKKDKHAWQHDARLRERIAGRRKTIYQTFLCGLARRYGVAIVAPIDAKELTENSEPEDLTADPTLQHRRAKWAAVSTLIQYAREKWPERCIEVDGANMSRQCMRCGHVNEPQGKRVQCHGCGATWDVDINAATVMLERGQAAARDGALDALVEAKEKKAEAAREKLAKMIQARRDASARKRAEMEGSEA
jgi:hypothetical protein